MNPYATTTANMRTASHACNQIGESDSWAGGAIRGRHDEIVVVTCSDAPSPTSGNPDATAPAMYSQQKFGAPWVRGGAAIGTMSHTEGDDGAMIYLVPQPVTDYNSR
jgi:hypothetical protein